MFKRNGVYFLLTSGATGWGPNQQRYATATSVTGTWSALANIGDNTAYGSQTAYVLPVQGTPDHVVPLPGRPVGGRLGRPGQRAREYVWLPLQFPSNTTMSMGWSPQVTIDTATGVGAAGGRPDRTNVVARHSGKCLDITSNSTADSARALQWPCGSGTNQRFTVQDLGNGYSGSSPGTAASAWT